MTARYFATFIAVVVLLVFGVVLLTGGDSKEATTAQKAPITLADYIDKNSEVTMTIDGKANAEELHRVIRVKISPNQRVMDVIQGYNNTVLQNVTLTNSKASYDTFMRSIASSGFTRENKGAKQKDERGLCPLGQRFIFELHENGEQKQRLWKTSCGSTGGTFAGNFSTVRTLFQRQIPDFDKQTAGVQL